MGKSKYSKKNKKYIRKTIKMNCHPNNKQNIHKNTCYTKDALITIRDAYNKNHNEKIKTTTKNKYFL